MRTSDFSLAKTIDKQLRSFDKRKRSLPGIHAEARRECLVEQIIDSVRRIKYVSLIGERDVSEIRSDPQQALFDPIKAALWHSRNGNLDEAFWLVFLSVHFGKHKVTGWNLARGVYGRLGNGQLWDWERTSENLDEFLEWLDNNQEGLSGAGKFGNHRKYESIKAFESRGTGAAIRSYVDWVQGADGHQEIFRKALEESNGDRKAAFDHLYSSMQQVATFGRTARFDYLTMVGKLRLGEIEPGLTYMRGATGPLRGARLLFGKNNGTAKELEYWLGELEEYLGLYFGMQVLEDSLCNWQKNPTQFNHFGG